MKDPELKKDFEQIIPYLHKIIYIIPGVLLPASIAIYFFESKNVIQFLSINAFAIVLFFILEGLVKFTEKQVEKM